MNTQDVLVLAKKRIANRDNWTQGANSRNIVGDRVPYNDKGSVSWCAAGAIYATTEDWDLAIEARKALHAAIPVTDRIISVTRYNDSCTHTEVMEWFDRAIINTQSKE